MRIFECSMAFWSVSTNLAKVSVLGYVQRSMAFCASVSQYKFGQSYV